MVRTAGHKATALALYLVRRPGANGRAEYSGHNLHCGGCLQVPNPGTKNGPALLYGELFACEAVFGFMTDYLHSLFSLSGKVAIVTGASRGIGAAVVDALSGAGAYTVGIGRSVAPRCPFKAGADYRQCDVLDAERFKSLCAAIVESRNRLDILVNAAAITLPRSPDADADEVFDRTIALNLVAAHRCCQTAASHMRRTGGGSIVNITSLTSIFGFPENPGYGAAKGGLRVLSKALALDFAADGIRVNKIVPGYIRTDMTAASFNDPVRYEERLQRMMIKRWGATEDFAGAAIFLASNASSYVTGIDLIIDGGWAAKGL